MNDGVTLLHGDCLELLPTLPDQSVDAIICDPPYGTTDCEWDSVIPFEPMWGELKRIIKPRGAIVLFGSQPFTSTLIMSNPRMLKHTWVWNKAQSGSFHLAKYQPLKITEDVLVFSDGTVKYRPIMRTGRLRGKGGTKKQHEAIGGLKPLYSSVSDQYYPTNILDFPNCSNRQDRLHPTQKPVALMEYLIRTYTNESETVLDFTMGSGTTGVACVNTGRRFVGIERDDRYFQVASDRIHSTVAPLLVV